MFRSATTRIAHNSTVPGLARISKDLKALQELINTEKSVMQTLQKLAQDMAKASEAVKQWGIGEGDDLSDTLTGCNAVLLHFSSALSRFSNHEASMREILKAVRTREENLDDLKRRRKSLQSNADSADRKLSKMSAENKNFQAQADALNKLRDDIRTMDTEIMTEEASLGDFKRSSAKNCMGIKFGALMECCEKGYIVGELGKLIIAEIPLEPTEPGLPRPYYTGHARTEFLVAEAQRAVNEVGYSPDPNPNPTGRGIRPLPGSELPPVDVSGQYSRPPSSHITPTVATIATSSYGSEPSIRNSTRFSQNILSPPTGFIGLPEVSEGTIGSGGLGLNSYATDQIPTQPRSPPPHSTSPGSSSSFSPANPFASPPPQHPSLINTDVNEFGMYPAAGGAFSPRSSSLRNLGEQQPSSPVGMGGPRGGRFATFPVKTMGPRAQPGSPPPPQMPQPMDVRAPSLDIEGGNDSFSSSVAQALGHDWLASNGSPRPPMNAAQAKALEAGGVPADYASPPPQYSVTPDPSPPSTLSPYGAGQTGSTQPSTTTVSTTTPTPTVPEENEEEEDTSLAYITHDDEQASVSDESHGQGSRRVRFESSVNIPEDTHAGSSPQPSDQDHAAREQETHQQEGNEAQPTGPNQTELQPQIPPVETQTVEATAAPPSQVLPPVVPAPPAVPPPLSPEEEKAANAAAAREVSREMDALMFGSPGKFPPPSSAQPQPPSPLQPPAAPFAHGRISPARPESLRSTPGSPPLTPRESNYVRERDRSSSIPPASPGSDGARSPVTQQSPIVASPTIAPDTRPSMPPPRISLPPIRSVSPAFSSVSSNNAYSTPPDIPFTQPAGPGSFYNLPAMSGSGTLPGSGRTVAAGLFKRQMRSATSPAPTDGGQQPATADVSPLNLKKRALPASPYPSNRTSLPSDTTASPRIPSTLTPGGGDTNAGQNGQYRSVSGSIPRPNENNGMRPQSYARNSAYGDGEDDDYDYISAYVDDPSGGDDRRASTAGYGQGRFTTDLDNQHERR